MFGYSFMQSPNGTSNIAERRWTQFTNEYIDYVVARTGPWSLSYLDSILLKCYSLRAIVG